MHNFAQDKWNRTDNYNERKAALSAWFRVTIVDPSCADLVTDISMSQLKGGRFVIRYEILKRHHEITGKFLARATEIENYEIKKIN